MLTSWTEFVLTIPSSYLHRLDDELEMLDLQTEKRHTGSHYRLQQTSQEDAIRSIIVKERELFEGQGFGKQCSMTVHKKPVEL